MDDFSSSRPSPQPAEIRAALRRLGPFIRTTPVLTVPGPEFGLGPDQPNSTVHVHLKLEHLQHTGTFKARGAVNALIAPVERAHRVVAASGGNHGAAVAWAAQRLGIPADIFVPSIASPAKVDRLVSYGARVHIVGSVYQDALDASVEFADASGARTIHAYDDPLVVTGAGTVGCELSDTLGAIDHVVVACGGGGLSGGLAAWFGPSGPTIHVVETDGTATFRAALDAGEPVSIDVHGIAADALGATKLGEVGWRSLQAAGATSVLVTDDEAANARAWLWERFRLLIEPAAAATVAAVLSDRLALTRRSDLRPTSVAIVLCGANTALTS